MNLHGLVSGAIGVVNPFETVALEVSTGYTTDDDTAARVPSYATAVPVPAQVQALSFRDIQMLDGLNLQGTRRKIYLYGQVDGLVRVVNKGGDIITRSDESVWLVAMVLEQWPDWCSVAVTLQDGA